MREQLMPIAANLNTRKPTALEPPASSGRWMVDPDGSHARFLAGTLAGLVRTPGRFRALSGELLVGEAHAEGALVIDSSSIDTGNAMRDRHLRSRAFFDAKRHPQLRYEAHAISGEGQERARIDGELIAANTRSPLPLEVTLRTRSEGVIELVCHTEVDRVALGIRGARGMVPRTVELDVVITLRRVLT
jgi:polyisoprenoid-binding protein YceI